MKYAVLIFFTFIAFASCNSYKNNAKHSLATNNTTQNDTIRIANDSLEYEIIIIEAGFNSWLRTQRPRGYYTQNYLENRNMLYVTEYNQRVRNWQLWDPILYVQEINYDFNTDYGYEVNYLLYHYFIYFQQRYDQQLRAGRTY